MRDSAQPRPTQAIVGNDPGRGAGRMIALRNIFLPAGVVLVRSFGEFRLTQTRKLRFLVTGRLGRESGIQS